MRTLVGHDRYDDREFLLVIHDDGTHTIATRPGYRATDVSWSAPVELLPQSSAVSG